MTLGVGSSGIQQRERTTTHSKSASNHIAVTRSVHFVDAPLAARMNAAATASGANRNSSGRLVWVATTQQSFQPPGHVS